MMRFASIQMQWHNNVQCERIAPKGDLKDRRIRTRKAINRRLLQELFIKAFQTYDLLQIECNARNIYAGCS